MKLHFRLKIALLSLTLSGLLIAGFGIAFTLYIYRTGIDRMDRSIRSLIEAGFRAPRPPSYWENLDESIKFIYGNSPYYQLALHVTDQNGDLLYRSENAPPELTTLPAPPLPPPLHPPDRQIEEHPGNGFGPQRMRRRRFDEPRHPRPNITQFQTLKTTNGNWRTAVYRDPEINAAIAINMNAFYNEFALFYTSFLIAVPITILLLGIVGWILASRAMRPVSRMADIAEKITVRDLGQRIPDTGSDAELSRLTSVINHMLERLEKSYHQAVRFSADAAHELQSPLTILQGELDNAIQSAPPGSEEQQRYGSLLSDLSHLKAVVQKLLLLAHADEGRLNLQQQPTDLADMLRSALEDLEIIAANLCIEADIPAHAPLAADPALLHQLITNLTSNAAKYTLPGGTIHLSLKEDSDHYLFRIVNTADPIPEEDRDQLFDRFYRVDKSRNRAIPGSGLGLGLAHEIARAHGGELTLAQTEAPNVAFELKLPREKK